MQRSNDSSAGVPVESGQSPLNRLLLLGCSKAKSTHEEPIPALQRYDGPPFRVLRSYFRQRHDLGLRVFILSAEFGLIPSDQKIPPYERKMTLQRAHELRPQVSSTLRRILPLEGSEMWNRDDLLIVLGKDYLLALPKSAEPKTNGLENRVAAGSQGRKLSLLHDWLYGTPPVVTRQQATQGRPLRFRGVEFALEKDDVLELARRALREQQVRSTDLNAWCVVVDEIQVAPKWLVSQVTGLPVGSFKTSDALSFLARLRIEAERV